MMKQTFFAIFAAAVLLLGMGACTDKTDSPATPSQQELEQSLVGLWYEELINTKKTSDFCTEAVLDANSPLSLRFKEAFSKDALTSGWKPRSDFDIMLYHDTKDDVVPVDNYYVMKQFLDDNYIQTEGLVGDCSGTAKEDLGTTNHEASAATFFVKIIEWIKANYNQE
jgi:hypothetical protein